MERLLRLSDLVKRAGGSLATAYPGGARFIRTFANAGRVDVDLAQVMARPGTAGDIILQPGDELTIPEWPRCWRAWWRLWCWRPGCEAE